MIVRLSLSTIIQTTIKTPTSSQLTAGQGPSFLYYHHLHHHYHHHHLLLIILSSRSPFIIWGTAYHWDSACYGRERWSPHCLFSRCSALFQFEKGLKKPLPVQRNVPASLVPPSIFTTLRFVHQPWEHKQDQTRDTEGQRHTFLFQEKERPTRSDCSHEALSGPQFISTRHKYSQRRHSHVYV